MINPFKKYRDFRSRFISLPAYYGRNFIKNYNFLLKSKLWDREQLQTYKLNQLKLLVAHAENNVPYYRELFKQNSISSAQINTFEDFSQIPILTRNIIKNNIDRLKADNFQSYSPIKTETSGTTGEVATVYRSAYHESFRLAAKWRQWNSYGYGFKQRRANITMPWSNRVDDEVCELDKIENSLIINTFHIIAGNSDKVINRLKDFKPRLIWAQPTVLAALSEYIINHGIEPFEVDNIATYGEKSYPHVRKVIKQAFKGDYFEYYGNRENSIGAWGKWDNKFYELSEYCHLEIDKQTAVVEHPSAGELISTSLHNYAFPLIRYNSQDLAIMNGYISENDNYPQVELLGGRGKDLLLSSKGLTVPYLPHLYERKILNLIKKYQLYQKSINEVILKLVPLPDFDRKHDAEVMVEQFTKMLANNFQVSIEYVDDIPVTKSGKYPMAVSPLAIDYLIKL